MRHLILFENYISEQTQNTPSQNMESGATLYVNAPEVKIDPGKVVAQFYLSPNTRRKSFSVSFTDPVKKRNTKLIFTDDTEVEMKNKNGMAVRGVDILVRYEDSENKVQNLLYKSNVQGDFSKALSNFLSTANLISQDFETAKKIINTILEADKLRPDTCPESVKKISRFIRNCTNSGNGMLLSETTAEIDLDKKLCSSAKKFLQTI